MKTTERVYGLDPAPAYATLAAHAATFSQYCYETTPRSLEKLPIPIPVIAGKRQPMPIHVFAALLAKLDDEQLRGVCLADLPVPFVQSVQALLPKAIEAHQETKAA
ncbi:hypothetical protein [Sulfitobacter sp. JL08]|uniref:hypothetical protein n=1 Tax=Sulfitobacter sp. JL08 TaxID=2070369 RepID=UPI0013B35A80|nr:hypothetical protein [Sulfitobacter sp. JL08]